MSYDHTLDTCAQRSTPVSSQARAGSPVAPSDTIDLTPYAKALYVGVSGDLSLIPVVNYAAGNVTPVLFSNVPVGWFPMQVARVMATGTTAQAIVAVSS